MRSLILKNAGIKLEYLKRCSNSFAVVLPEVLTENLENHILVQKNKHPPLSLLTPSQLYNGVGNLCIKYDLDYNNFQTQLSDLTYPRTFENVLQKLEEMSAHISLAFLIIKHMNKLKKSQYSNVQLKINPAMQRISCMRFKSQLTYSALKEIKADVKRLSNAQLSVVEKYMALSILNGVDLTGSKEAFFQRCLADIEYHKNMFMSNLNKCRIDEMQLINDRKDIPDMPEDALNKYNYDPNHSHQTGPWYISFEPENYSCFMKYLTNRKRREALYLTYNTLAGHRKNLQNGKTIDEIMYLRRDIAKLLSYKNYVQMSFSNKMVQDETEIYNFLDGLWEAAHPVALKELQELALFVDQTSPTLSSGLPIKSNKKGSFLSMITPKLNGTKDSVSIEALEPWDLPYWTRLHRERLFPYNSKMRFEYHNVLGKMFGLCKTLFNIRFEKTTPSPTELLEDFECYRIKDDADNIVAHLYIDPVGKPNDKVAGVWSDLGQNKSDLRGDIPYAILSMDLIPAANNSLYMNFTQLQELFYQFGRTLPHLLTTVPYSDVAGLNYVEKDCENVGGYFFKLWLRCPDILGQLVTIYPPKDSSQLPADPAVIENCTDTDHKNGIVKDLISEMNYMAGVSLLSDLFYSHIDIEIHSRHIYYLDAFNNLWSRYNLFKLPRNLNPLASFSPIFVEDLAANYYSKLWSRAMAAQLFSAFIDDSKMGKGNGFCVKNDQQCNEIGKRLLQHYISIGAVVKQREALKNFDGKDFKSEPFIKLHLTN